MPLTANLWGHAKECLKSINIRKTFKVINVDAIKSGKGWDI